MSGKDTLAGLQPRCKAPEQGIHVMHNIQFKNPGTMSKPPGYTHVVEVTGPGRTIYIAGQLGLDANGKLVGAPGDFRAQTAQAFNNLKAALGAVGAEVKHIVKINNYIVDISKNIGTFRELRDQHLNMAAPPASTAVGVPALAVAGALFEIEAIVALPA
jgi:enamine deaminase RidA (YjgF/YER057c/UK114 family)